MERLWRDPFSYEEGRLIGVLILLSAPDWYEPGCGAPPEGGMELISVSETRERSGAADGKKR